MQYVGSVDRQYAPLMRCSGTRFEVITESAIKGVRLIKSQGDEGKIRSYVEASMHSLKMVDVDALARIMTSRFSLCTTGSYVGKGTIMLGAAPQAV